MSPSRFTLPSIGSIVPDLAAFAIGLECMHLMHWTTTDLVWSLWLGSLVIGYLSILSVIGKGLYIGAVVVGNETFPAQYRGRSVLIGLALAAFVVGFFSLHFCGFHAAHASVLSQFFPLSGVPRGGFGRGFMNPILLWKDAFHYVMPSYGLFLIPLAIAERRVLIGPIEALVQAGRLGSIESAATLWQASGASAHGLISRPYLNVMRMHFLIIFLGILHALRFDAFPVFFAVYSVYFFPWSAFRRASDEPKAA